MARRAKTFGSFEFLIMSFEFKTCFLIQSSTFKILNSDHGSVAWVATGWRDFGTRHPAQIIV
jgi:hypothetical protein